MSKTLLHSQQFFGAESLQSPEGSQTKVEKQSNGMSVQSDSSSVKLKFGGHTDTYPNVRRVSSQLLPLLPNACHGLSAQLDLAITQREMLISKVAVADSLSVP